MSGEFELINWIRTNTPAQKAVTLGIGDDFAILQFQPGWDTLVTTDMLMEGRHFILADATPEAVGYKALAVNLSDIAAMGGIPIAAVVSVALPRGEASTIAKGLHAGMMPLAERFGVSLAGGDTNAWDGPLVVNITLLGEVEPGKAIARGGALAGDTLFVSGPLGGSLLARHLKPEPRIELARELAERVAVHAMIDISDGLLSDLGHILDSSGGLGAQLEEVQIPIHSDARTMAERDGRTALDHALNDGEDFELLMSAHPDDAGTIIALGWKPIGIVQARKGIEMRQRDGQIRSLEPKGFDHLRDRG